MPLITEYKVEEHTWTTGYQLTEQINHGYIIKLTHNKISYWSLPILDLKLALKQIKMLEEFDGK